MKKFKNINNQVDHLFRYEASRITSWLVKKFGSDKFDLIEDAVQHSLLRAMQTWPFREVPQNPAGWILITANNYLIDSLRTEKIWSRMEEDSKGLVVNPEINPQLENELQDDLLAMMFACCHPLLSEDNQIVLSLKILCSFNNREVARALVKKEEAVAKAYTRAKIKFKERVCKPEIPIGGELNQRLDVVLRVIYLLFNEGYNSMSEDSLIRTDLCDEAMRLNRLLLDKTLLRKPKVHALMALMYFQASRFDARIGDGGELLTLDRQDRSKWNRSYIELGLKHLQIAYAFGMISPYHIEANIAAFHVLAPHFEETDWESIYHAYRVLEKMNAGKIVKLNAIVAESYYRGPQAALVSLNELEKEKDIKTMYLFYSIKGSLHERCGEKKKAIDNYTLAREATTNKIEKAYLNDKIRWLR